MAPIPAPISYTVDAIYKAYAAKKAESYDGLGISISDLGNECARSIWYSFRWASPHEVITGLKAITFETGEIEEERLLTSLEMIDCEVERVDPQTGKQVRTTAVFGFVRGKIDGKVVGLPEAPKTWHVVECKSAKETYFKEIAKKGVREGYFAHWVQLNTYCHLLGFERGLYMCRNKNTGEIYCERIETDHDTAIRMLADAERIVDLHEPPAKLHLNPKAKTAFKCRSMCKHLGVCHEGAFPRVNCRTCLHATPEHLDNATFSCARWNKPLLPDEQREGCPAHLYLPALVPGEMTAADDEAETVTYRLKDGSTWVDGSGKAHPAETVPAVGEAA